MPLDDEIIINEMTSCCNAVFVSILEGGLAARGSDQAGFVLDGKLTLNDANRQNDWYWMRDTVAVSLVE